MLRLFLPRTLSHRVFAATRAFSLPSHEMIGLPALSPTMEVGTIISWNKAEGDLVRAGETIAEIETDKATISFDAVDDAYLAKILVEAGREVAVGSPIMVMVDEQEDVAAFSSFTAPVINTSHSPVHVPDITTPSHTPAPTPAPSPKPSLQQQATTAAPVPPASTQTPPVPPPTAKQQTAAPLQWGSLISASSPLAAKIARDQRAYVEKYGNSCHAPVDC